MSRASDTSQRSNYDILDLLRAMSVKDLIILLKQSLLHHLCTAYFTFTVTLSVSCEHNGLMLIFIFSKYDDKFVDEK